MLHISKVVKMAVETKGKLSPACARGAGERARRVKKPMVEASQHSKNRCLERLKNKAENINCPEVP